LQFPARGSQEPMMTVTRNSLQRQLIGLLLAALILVCGVAAKRAGAADEAAPAAIPANLGNAVVKVFATLRLPDPYRPWTKQAPTDITASGVVIEGHRILTNAHAVLYASQVQIQGAGAGDKISATVEAVAPGIDLAVLKLDDESFFSSHGPLARANALTRRPPLSEQTTVLRVGDLEMNLIKREVRRGGQPVDLQQREFQLLEFLMRHAGHVVTRTMLLEGVWDYHFDPQTNVIDVHISRLRQAIDKDFDKPLLHTVRGAGYSLREDE